MIWSTRIVAPHICHRTIWSATSVPLPIDLAAALQHVIYSALSISRGHFSTVLTIIPRRVSWVPTFALRLSLSTCMQCTAECCYNAVHYNMIIYAVLQWPGQNIKSEFVPTKDTPYLALAGELWVSIVAIAEKTDVVTAAITASHCISFLDGPRYIESCFIGYLNVSIFGTLHSWHWHWTQLIMVWRVFLVPTFALRLSLSTCIKCTAECCHNAVHYNMIIYAVLQWPGQNIKSEFVLTKDNPYLALDGELWVSIVAIAEHLHERGNLTYAMFKHTWAPVSWSGVAAFHLAACVCTSSNDKELIRADKAYVLTDAYH